MTAVAMAAIVPSTSAIAADPAPSSTAAPGKERAARAEKIEGSTVKRVILSAKAAERAGIETAKILDQPVAATQMFGATIVDAASANIAQSPASNAKAATTALAIRVGVSPSEAARIDRTKPARVVPLETRKPLDREVVGKPVEQASTEGLRSGMVVLSYAIEGNGAGLAAGTRVRAELPLQGDQETRKTVPYSAVYYDAKGNAWVYVMTAPLQYERKRVDVERVAGSLAVLSSGPDAGTSIVAVGAPLLYGVEVFGK